MNENDKSGRNNVVSIVASQARTRQKRSEERIQDRIGDELRKMYDHLLQEPVPDHLLDLLKKFDEKEQEQKE
jgi:hypothetical protein